MGDTEWGVIVKNLRIILIRRGENMRITLPVDPVALTQYYPPELALEAAKMFLRIQQEDPGRSDMPIVVGDKPFGLTLPESDYVLDPKTNIAVQLAGRWQDEDVDLFNPDTGKVEKYTRPCVALNLDDIHD